MFEESSRTFFAKKLRTRYHAHRSLDALEARTAEVLAAQAHYSK